MKWAMILFAPQASNEQNGIWIYKSTISSVFFFFPLAGTFKRTTTKHHTVVMETMKLKRKQYTLKLF